MASIRVTLGYERFFKGDDGIVRAEPSCADDFENTDPSAGWYYVATGGESLLASYLKFVQYDDGFDVIVPQDDFTYDGKSLLFTVVYRLGGLNTDEIEFSLRVWTDCTRLPTVFLGYGN